MFCSTLANKITKSDFKLKIQIFIKIHPSPPPHQKKKGKIQQLCSVHQGCQVAVATATLLKCGRKKS